MLAAWCCFFRGWFKTGHGSERLETTCTVLYSSLYRLAVHYTEVLVTMCGQLSGDGDNTLSILLLYNALIQNQLDKHRYLHSKLLPKSKGYQNQGSKTFSSCSIHSSELCTTVCFTAIVISICLFQQLTKELSTCFYSIFFFSDCVLKAVVQSVIVKH